MSRDKILAAIQAQSLPDIPLPDASFPGMEYEDPIARFKESVESVGGRCAEVTGRAALAEVINREFPGRGRTVTTLPDLGLNAEICDDATDPHSLENVSLAILPGQFGVAENAAIWVDDARMGQRSLPFITEHLVLVVEKSDVVSNMHQAYARLVEQNNLSGFGVFISGPSKTADIEQSLVLGAHGSRSLLVVLCESSGWRAQVGNIKTHLTRIKSRG
jgi:L-lactate dehydrogenase complex protein LldG